MRRAALTLILVLVCSTVPLLTRARPDAQEGTPAARPHAPDLSIVASGLTSPRGMAWDPNGTLYVALAGRGGTRRGVPAMRPPLGPFMGGLTASVARIVDGCPEVVAKGLPSMRDAQGGVYGVNDLAFLGGQLYLMVAGGGALYGNPGTTNGVYRVNADGTTTLIADTWAWLTANVPWDMNRPAPPAGVGNPGLPFAMVADAAAGVLWIVDADTGVVLTVSPDGMITLVASLATKHPTPTGIALAPGGGVYVGNLTSLPYPNGTAEVVHVAPDGTVTEVWTGLTAVTGVAVGPNGDLYALEMSTGNTAEPPFLRPHSGRVVRQVGTHRLEEVVTGLLYPVALDVGPDESFYVAQPAFGGHDGSGVIVRIETGPATASGAATSSPVAPECPKPGTTS